MNFYKNLSKPELRELFNDDKKLTLLYQKLFPSIKKLVLENSGTIHEAKDLFQEVIIVVYKNLQNPDFQLTSSLETFCYSVARNKWLYELRKKKIVKSPIETSDSGNNLIDLIITEERARLFQKHLDQLSDGCRTILNLFFNGKKMNQIATKLGFSSEGYARKRKHNCQEKLIQSIKNDPLFEELRYE